MKKLLNKFPKLVTFSHKHKISAEQKRTFNLPSQQSSVVNYVKYKNHIIAREKVRKTFNLIPFSIFSFIFLSNHNSIIISSTLYKLHKV
jgi:hypothetical protein